MDQGSTAVPTGNSEHCAWQVSADYVVPHLTLKTSVGLTNQPKVDLAATTGYKDIVFGGEATYDSAKGDVTKWAAGAGELCKGSCPWSQSFVAPYLFHEYVL